MNLSKVIHFLIPLILFINLKYPIKYMLSCLELSEYFPIFCGLYSCMYLSIICMVDGKTLPDAMKFIIIFTWSLVLSLLVLNVFTGGVITELVGGVTSTAIPLALFADAADTSTSGTSRGETGNSTVSGGSSADKNTKTPKVKPDLTIKIGPQTDHDKDKSKLANCTHDKTSNFKITSEEEAENTFCDFSNDTEDKGDQHKAFDGPSDNAFICDDCFGILCKNCVQDYSDSDE